MRVISLYLEVYAARTTHSIDPPTQRICSLEFAVYRVRHKLYEQQKISFFLCKHYFCKTLPSDTNKSSEFTLNSLSINVKTFENVDTSLLTIYPRPLRPGCTMSS